MLVLDAESIRRFAPIGDLIRSLAQAFRADCVVPLRQVCHVPGGAGDRLFVAMPAFDVDGAVAVKLVTVFPGNGSNGLPAAQAAVVIFSNTGTPQALLDGTIITYLRTGAASALASQYLSREDSTHLVVIGTGALAPTMAAAHSSVRPISRITVCGRRIERAKATAETIKALVSNDIELVASSTAEGPVSTADIVTCATSSATPVVLGKWLKPGTLVDLVGSFSPSTREADDDVVLRSRIFVDTFSGALAEAGDIVEPLTRGLIGRERIEGELADLVRGRLNGRANADEIILFKSVGTAIEDLAAARLIIANYHAQ